MIAKLTRVKPVVYLLIMLMALSDTNNHTVINNKRLTVNDTSGPEFLDVDYRFSDIKYSAEKIPLNLTLGLSVRIRDPDGIDTVIGSYKKRNETSWYNLTLSLNETYENHEYRYFGYGPSFSLDLHNQVMAWDVRFYANDTLGNWNVSEIGGYSYALLNPQYPLDFPLIIGIIVGFGMIVFVVVVFIRKKGMTD